MRKIYSILLMALMCLGISFQAKADITVKVNQTGVVTIDTNGSRSTLDQAVTTYSYPLIAAFEVSGTTMKVTNETTGAVIGTPNATRVDVHPGFVQDGQTLNIEVSGAGTVVDEQLVTFVFSPAGCGYVVTTRENGGVMIEDKTYAPAPGDEEVQVPYDVALSYLVKPNEGYALQNAKDETQTSNPHYTGLPASPTDGFIHGDMASLQSGAIIVVTAVKSGVFTVSGVGEKIENIVMMNLSGYETVPVAAQPQTVDFKGGAEFKIYSATTDRLWKVEVTDAENYTTELAGTFGNFWYSPNDGDRVVIYSDVPESHANVHITFDGEGVDDEIVSKVLYANETVDKETWSAESWDVVAGEVLRIYFNETGFSNITCTVNGEEQTISTNSQDGTTYVEVNVQNASETPAEYSIVISAEKEKECEVTFNCQNPEGVVIRINDNWVLGEPLEFTTTGQQFSFPAGTNLKIVAASGWILNGLLVDGKEPAQGTFVDGYLTIGADCTIEINVSSKADLRTKTAVVYVDEDVENPTYLALKFSGEQESQPIKPGYNFVKFADIDLPMSFGYYVDNGKDALYFVNGEKVSTPEPCPQTVNLADGSVIKFFNGLPVQQVVTYSIDDEVADMIVINHDYTVVADHATTKQFALYKGTQIHISAVAVEEAASRAEALSPIVVKVDGTEIQPGQDGLYAIKVGDTAPTIAISKAASGLEDIISDAEGTFTIFNLQGMAVKTNATAEDFSSLPAGVYIANGVKVLVK